MTAARRLLDLIAADLPADALILHLGPGRLEERAAYPGPAARLVLVEPDPAAADLLAARTADRPDSLLIRAALVLAPASPGAAAAPPDVPGGQVALWRWSHAACDSTLPPGAGLRALFPGLQARPSLMVPALPLADLLDRLPPPAPGPARDILLVEVPGLAWALVRDLAAAGALARFARIGLVMAKHPAHAGEAAVDNLTSWLDAKGFTTAAPVPLGDPAFVLLAADRRPAPVLFNPAAARDWARLGPGPGGLPRLIEVKSLPRSGLHFLRAGLAAGWGAGFSFCEWYQEPGCCQQMPCALTCLADPAARGAARGPLLRMTKSHDFDLTDPDAPPEPGMLRLILVRDPLAVLTSWAVLHLMDNHRDALAAAHLDPRMVYHNHHPALVAAVLARIETGFTPPGDAGLAAWLDLVAGRIMGFARKWTRAATMDPAGHRLLTYDQVGPFVAEILGRLAAATPPGRDRDRLLALQAGETARFTPRTDLFTVPGAPRISAWMAAAAPQFHDTAGRIRAALPGVDFGA